MARGHPSIIDFGGDSYEHPRRIRRSKDNMRSFRCMECNSTHFHTLLEASRSAAIRCLSCGGPVEETEESKKRHLNRLHASKHAKDSAKNDEHNNRKTTNVCACCGSKWTDMNALMYHATRNTPCLTHYADPNDIVSTYGKAFYKKTVHIFSIGNFRHEITGIGISGKLEVIKTVTRPSQAKTIFDEIMSGKMI